MMVLKIPHQKINVRIRNKGNEAICSSLNHQLNNCNILIIPATIKTARNIFFTMPDELLSRNCQRLDLFFVVINESVFQMYGTLVDGIKQKAAIPILHCRRNAFG